MLQKILDNQQEYVSNKVRSLLRKSESLHTAAPLIAPEKQRFHIAPEEHRSKDLYCLLKNTMFWLESDLKPKLDPSRLGILCSRLDALNKLFDDPCIFKAIAESHEAIMIITSIFEKEDWYKLSL